MPLLTMKKYRSNNQLAIDDNLTKKLYISLLSRSNFLWSAPPPLHTYISTSCKSTAKQHPIGCEADVIDLASMCSHSAFVTR
jgi:hypothetical protein